MLRGEGTDPGRSTTLDQRAGELVRELRAEIQGAWTELLALETLEPWVAEGFEDEEFADRVLGQLLREVREEIEEIRQYTSDLLGEFELPPADREFLAYVESVLHPLGEREAKG